ncbi:MAG: Fur family transcriptional regulator [Lachnospiraceae bacterium]
MNTGKRYHTKQKEMILQCLQEHAVTYVTINQIFEFLEKKEQKVGLTTIYRNLDKLEVEKRLTRVNIEGVQGTCYKYLPEDENNLFYLKCEACGGMVNIKCPELEYLYSHVVEEHRVRINPVKTMFYGTCESCITTNI